MDLGLEGKAALVTGASKGLGFAIAMELAREGAHVSICARSRKDLDIAAEKLRPSGVSVPTMTADVTANDDITRVVNETVAELGRLDILVNNTGDAATSVGI